MTPSPEERTRHVEDLEIRRVRDHYDDPEHPDALSVDEARRLLGDVQRALENGWSECVREVRGGDLELLRDTGEVVALRDPDRREWTRLLDEIDRFDRVDRTILRVSHRLAAERLLGREFEGVDPILARKPDDAEAGQRLTEAAVNRLLRAGAPPNEAWAYYGVEIRGLSVREWADRCGRDDRATVADAVETARDRLSE